MAAVIQLTASVAIETVFAWFMHHLCHFHITLSVYLQLITVGIGMCIHPEKNRV